MLLSPAKNEERNIASAVNSAIAVLFLSSLGVGVFFFVFPLVAFRSNWPGGWLGLVFSGYFLVRLLLAPLAGAFSDRYSPQRLLLAATCCAASLVFLYCLFPSQYTLLAIQFGLGICSGVLKPVLFGYLAKITPLERQGWVFGWSTAATNMVFFLGPAFGGLLFSYLELDSVLLVVAALLVAASLVLLFFPGKEPFGLWGKSNVADSVNPCDISVFRAALLFAVFGRTLGISSLLVFFPILLAQQLACPDWLTGLLVALPGGVSCLLLPFTGRFADRFDRTLLILGGMTMSAAALVAVGYCESIEAFSLTGLVMGLGTALSLPSSMVRATESGAAKGQAMGVFQMAASAGFLLGPIGSGLLVQWTASAAQAMSFAGVLGLCSCVPLAMSAAQRKKSRILYGMSGILVLGVVFGLIFGSGFVRKQDTSSLESASSPNEQETHTFANLAMGGIVHLKLEGASASIADQAASEAFEVIAELERDFGHRNTAGSIGNVNRLAGKSPGEVSLDAFRLIDRALRFCAQSKGVFDITIGAVTIYPQYYREKISQSVAPLVDYRKVSLDPEKRTVFLPTSGMALDLGGLAKGSIVDAAAAAIKKAGVPNALIEASGDFYCYGDRIWRVGIQDPRGEGFLGVIEVANAGVCGSGDYYQYVDSVEDNGERSHHILDPENFSSATRSIGVTVIAPSTELADALATTLFIMGPERGQQFLKKFTNCAALWVLPNGNLVSSEDFPAFIE